MLPNTPTIDSTHQDKNNEMNAVGLYSRKKCYASVTSFLTLFCDVNINTLHRNFTLRIE